MMAEQTGTKTGRNGRPGRRPVLLLFLVLALLVGAAVVGGVLPRLSRQKGLLAASEEVKRSNPMVIVSAAHLAGGKETVDLPGDLQPIIESSMFARADGYLKRRLADIGDRVKSGQLLAEIETPELDQQIGQARATLAQAQATIKELEAEIAVARANVDMARVTRDRWKNLFDRGVVSRQENDERQADFAVKQAQAGKAEAGLATAQETIHASQANLRRLEELKGFARVTAPFDGIVTARNVDVGTLINAGNGGASKEMFRVARIEPLRIFVNVPQSYVSDIRTGQQAELRIQERPGVFPARVTNVSQSLDANSRAMLVVLETPNRGGVLYPGMYAQVSFAIGREKPVLRVPGDAIVMGKDGARVATVDGAHRVHFRQVKLGEDLGSEVEILFGLSPGEMVISNPSDAVAEDAIVEVRAR